MSPSVCLHQSVCVTLSVYVCLFLFVCVSLWLFVCVCLSVYVCLFDCVRLITFVCVCVSFCVSLYVSLCLCQFVCVCVSLPVHLSIFVCLLVCLWRFMSLPRCDLFVFQIEVGKMNTKSIQPFSLHGFSVFLDLPDFHVSHLFVRLNLKSKCNTFKTFAQLRMLNITDDQLRSARSCSESCERRWPRRCACLLFLLVNPCCCCW